MLKPPPNTELSDEATSDRCYVCLRPRNACFCDTIPEIDNQTHVLILQHVKERFHPFGTARIVRRALARCELLVDQTCRLARAKLPLRDRPALLFPSTDARLLSDVPLPELPDQLVILDGTWHHAKTLVRDIPALRDLPRVRLSPSSPGRYRIRREPTATSLSTLEATVAALQAIEPETAGLDRLLDAFVAMIDRQLAHPKFPSAARRNFRRGRTPRNIPLALGGDLENIVVAYGESSPGGRGSERAEQVPVYWVAQRLGTGERFASIIRPDFPLTSEYLGHLDLTCEEYAEAVSPERFRAAWAAFLRPTDTLTVYGRGTARLLENIGAARASCLLLKSVTLRDGHRGGTIDQVLAANELTPGPPVVPGRAGRRLANAAAVARYFHDLAGGDGKEAGPGSTGPLASGNGMSAQW